MKNKKFKYSYIILLVLVVLLSLVVFIGGFSYRRMSRVVDQIDQTIKEDNPLIKIKDLQAHIGVASNSAKTYGLTKNSEYLTEYYTEIKLVDELLNHLYEMDQQADLDSQMPLLQLDSLVVSKFEILQEYVSAHDDYRVDNVLDQVIEKIESEQIKSPQKPAPLNTSKRGISDFAKRLFNKENKARKLKEQSVEFDPKDMSSLDRKIAAIKRAEGKINSRQINDKLELLSADHRVTRQIDSLVTKFELSQSNLVAKRAEEASNEIRFINNQITFFFINTGLLVILIIGLTYRYIKTNNKFEQALKDAKSQAEELAETKERFLNNMSHEIRTPMNAISGFINQLSRSRLSQEQQEQVSIIKKSSDYLLHIIDEVLVFNKLQINKSTLENRAFDFKGLVADIIQILQPQATKKGIVLNYSIAIDVPQVLLGDPYKLNQILINIVGNAIKFTTDGSVSLVVTNSHSTSEKCTLKFEIIDTGIGMTDDQLKKVFDEFEQAEVSTTRNFGGTGLGLSITKKLVELYKGSLDVTSKIDEGTTFIIEIEFGLGKIEDIYVIREYSSTNEQLRDLNVLIVDDELYNRKLLQIILKRHHVHVSEVQNGKEAIAAVQENRFDVILMDSRMPVMDGIEATKAIRAIENKEVADVPIIALSAAVSEADQRQYQNVGMNGFLAKPFKESQLIQEIIRAISADESEVFEIEVPKSKKKSKQANFKNLEELSGGDRAFFVDMLETFVHSMEEGLVHLKEEAAKENIEMVAEYAHKMASPCNHLSLTDLYQALKKLEKGGRKGTLKMTEVNALIEGIELEVAQAIQLANNKLIEVNNSI